MFFPCLTDEPLVHLHPWFIGGENQDWVIPSAMLKAGTKSCRREALAHLMLFPDVFAKLDANVS